MAAAIGVSGSNPAKAEEKSKKETQTQVLAACIEMMEKSDFDAKIVVKIEVISLSEILMRTSTDYDQEKGRGAIIRFKKSDGNWDLKVEGAWQS